MKFFRDMIMNPVFMFGFLVGFITGIGMIIASAALSY